MRTRRQWFDSGLFITLLLCLFAVWPVLTHDGLMRGTDTMLHAYRAAEMDRSWAHGVLIPDWAESFYYGYGSPVFHYYASLAYYASSLFVRLFGLTILGSIRLLMVVSLLGAGAGMYAFLREYTGKLGGVLAALSYVYCPYLVFTEPYTRGDFPELLAFALFPVVMWRFARLLHSGRARDVFLAALSLALLTLSHNLMAVVLAGLLMAWLVWQVVVEIAVRKVGKGDLAGRSYRQYVLCFITAGLGIGLTAFFWLPVLLESDAVSLQNLTSLPQLDYRNSFVTLNRLLAASPPTDIGSVNGYYLRLNLGLAQWTLALAGLAGMVILAAARVRTQHAAPLRDILHDSRFQNAVFFALVSLALVFLMTPASDGIWARFNVVRYLQFPWRLLGPAAFGLAFLAGMNTTWIDKLPARWGQIVTAVIVALPVALAFPTLYVPNWLGGTADMSAAGYQQAEINGLTSPGTTASNEFIPKTVYAIPGPTQSLLDEYAIHYAPEGDGLVNRINPNSIPPDAQITVREHGPQHDEWVVTAETPFALEILTLDFDGWKATVDGEPVDVTPTDPHGFIRLAVPAGEHIVRLSLGSTPARDLGKIVAGISALALLACVRMVQIRRGGSQTRPYNDMPGKSQRIGLLAGVALTIVLAVIFMREGLAWVNSPPGEAIIAQHPMTYHLGDRLQVIGYDLSSDHARPGDLLEMVIYWYASEQPEYNYSSFIHVSAGGPPLAQADKQQAGELATTRWPLGGYMRDEYTLQLPDDMPPGDYMLTVGLFTCDTRPPGECGNGDRLPVTDADGNPIGDTVPLGTITVR